MRLHQPQRIVLVIGWGLALSAVASYLVALAENRTVNDGWFNYVPSGSTGLLSSEVLTEGPLLGSLLIWLVAVLLWVAGSLWVLNGPAGR